MSAPHTSSRGVTASPPPARRARVLLVGSDRRFRAVAATLLARRGYPVSVGSRDGDIVELARASRAEVVVIDASASLGAAARQAARLDSVRPRVGVVTVSGVAESGHATRPVLSKWSSFDAVLAAIDRASRNPQTYGEH
jgi:ActR/RegA family two-component response regulator